MKINEEVFRHEVLDTKTLDNFLTLKQNWDFCNDKFIPLTCGVFPADETPSENFDFVNNQQISWISNTDPSHKPGMHWVSILRDAENLRSTASGDEMEICRKVIYYVVDSWGSKHTDKTCKHIIETLEGNFTMANFNHSTHMLTANLHCICQFEINFPVLKRIQHVTFENCRWYALQFCNMSKEELIKWANSDLNDYGQIKPNYTNMTEYFKKSFFPIIVQPTCVDYIDYKIKTIN